MAKLFVSYTAEVIRPAKDGEERRRSFRGPAWSVVDADPPTTKEEIDAMLVLVAQDEQFAQDEPGSEITVVPVNWKVL